jgi:hypothetical protein
MPGRPARTRALTAAAALAVIVTGVLLPAPGSSAATAADGIVLRIDTFTPEAPLAGQSLTVGGSLTTTLPNGTGALSIRLRVLTPVAGRSDLVPALNPHSNRVSRNVRSIEIAPASNNGDVLPWDIAVPVSALHLGIAGVYPIAIDAISGGKTLGTTRTLLPWFPAGTPLTRLGVTMVWPISGVPEVNAAGAFSSEILPQSMNSGGRLDILSSVAQSSTGISPLVDPFLLQAARDGSAGYKVVAPNGKGTVNGANANGLATWLSKTEVAMGQNPSAITAYGDIDAAAMLDANQNPLVLQSLHTSNVVTAGIFAAPNTRLRVFLPESGWVTTKQALQLARDGAAAIVVTSSMVPTKPTLNYTSSGRANYTSGKTVAKFVLADASLSSAVTHAGTANPTTLRQRLLGESLLIALELPSVHRTIAVAPWGLWTPTSDTAQAVVDGLLATRWTSPVTLDDLIAQQPPTVKHVFRNTPNTIRQEQISGPQVASVIAATSPLTDVKSVVPALDPLRVNMEQGQLRASSQGWRTFGSAGRVFASNYLNDVQAARDSLTIRVPKTIVIPGESGVLPVTIVNGLGAPVNVRISVQATPSFRLVAKDTGLITVVANRRHSLEVPITVFGSGALQINVRLTADDGRVVTNHLVVQVRSSAYSRVAAVVAGLAFLALLGLSIASITRRVRNRGKDDE